MLFVKSPNIQKGANCATKMPYMYGIIKQKEARIMICRYDNDEENIHIEYDETRDRMIEWIVLIAVFLAIGTVLALILP